MGIEIGLGIVPAALLGRRAGGAAPPAFEPESEALFARMTVAPDAARKAVIDTLVAALKAGGVWGKLDGLWLLAAHDAQAARANWISAAYTLTATGSPAFTTDRGFAGNGSSSYLDTGFNPTAAGGRYALNSACLGLWSRTAAAAATSDMGVAGYAAMLRVRHSDGNCQFFLNKAFTGPSAVAAPDGTGFRCASRSGATAGLVSVNGTRTATALPAADTLPNASITILRLGSEYSSRQLSAAFIGSHLAIDEQAALHGALGAYLAAIGA